MNPIQTGRVVCERGYPGPIGVAERTTQGPSEVDGGLVSRCVGESKATRKRLAPLATGSFCNRTRGSARLLELADPGDNKKVVWSGQCGRGPVAAAQSSGLKLATCEVRRLKLEALQLGCV